ncbi:hypothetical protein PENTCL1PPCAC_15337, partial [Pristionchus entomophagus]
KWKQSGAKNVRSGSPLGCKSTVSISSKNGWITRVKSSVVSKRPSISSCSASWYFLVSVVMSTLASSSHWHSILCVMSQNFLSASTLRSSDTSTIPSSTTTVLSRLSLRTCTAAPILSRK